MRANIASSMMATMMRATNGIQSTPAASKPQKTLQLYDIENCPYCRLVREATNANRIRLICPAIVVRPF